MGQITLNREDCEKLLADPETEPGTRVVAALGMALFEVNEHAFDADSRELSIARKLAHMIACGIFDAIDELGPQA